MDIPQDKAKRERAKSIPRRCVRVKGEVWWERPHAVVKYQPPSESHNSVKTEGTQLQDTENGNDKKKMTMMGEAGDVRHRKGDGWM